MNGNTSGILQMDSISVKAVTGGWNSHVVDENGLAVIKFKMALRAVLNSNTGDGNIRASIEPQSLPHKEKQVLV